MRITGRGLTAATALGALILAGCGGPADEVGEQTPATAEATPSQVSADSSSPSASAEPAASPSASESQAGPVEQDPELASLLAGLIIGDVPPVSLKATANVGADCGFDGGGCYLPDEKTIYLSDETTQFRRPELLAHEYLHYRWETEGLDDDAELAAALEKAFGDKEGLGSLVPSWQEEYLQPDGSILPTELFSYSCTGQRPDQQEAIVAERCAEYLKVEALPVNQKLTTTALTDESPASARRPRSRSSNSTRRRPPRQRPAPSCSPRSPRFRSASTPKASPNTSRQAAPPRPNRPSSSAPTTWTTW